MTTTDATFAADFSAAFDADPGARRNYVTLAALRSALPQYSREAFDAGLQALRFARQFSLDSADGRHVRMTDAELDAGIREAGACLVYCARR